MNTKRVAFATAFIEAFLYWVLLAGLMSISIWSFAQTWQFTNNGSEVGIELIFSISFWLAVVIQYSQNAFLFMAFISKNKHYNITDKLVINIRYIYMLGWIITSVIDAGTNVGQWRADNPDVASTWNIYSITWQLICVGCIFVEELFITTAGITLHKTNEWLVSMNFGGFDVFWLPDLMNHGFPRRKGNDTDFVNSFNPSKRHLEDLMRRHGGDKNNVGQSNSGKKNKGQWQPGKPGRPPKNALPPELEKILDDER